MQREIKSLTSNTPKSPAWWTMFLDATDPPAFSYARIIGFIVISVFLSMAAYISFSTGSLVVPPKEWVYILVAFSLMKPIQRFAESKDNASQLNYEFQMAQLSMGQSPSPLVNTESTTSKTTSVVTTDTPK